jgi:hypothetical protein
MYVLFEWAACVSGQGTPVFFCAVEADLAISFETILESPYWGGGFTSQEQDFDLLGQQLWG